jgi:hypothetical protein
MYLLSVISISNMKQVTKYFGVVAIIAIFALATISGSIGEADAQKGKGKHAQSYGHKNSYIVCGAKLCSSGENPDPINDGRAH